MAKKRIQNNSLFYSKSKSFQKISIFTLLSFFLFLPILNFLKKVLFFDLFCNTLMFIKNQTVFYFVRMKESETYYDLWDRFLDLLVFWLCITNIIMMSFAAFTQALIVFDL